MKESDSEYYEAIERQDAKIKRSHAMARARGEASIEWHKTNKLTKETLPQFKAFMKSIDKKFNGDQRGSD